MRRIIKKPDERRRELLDAGFNLFMQKGVEDISVKEIAGQAHVATGLFYYYFSSKESFVDEALNDFISNSFRPLVEALREKKAAREKLPGVLSECHVCIRRARPFAQTAAFRGRERTAFIDRLYSQLLPSVEQFIEEGRREGVFQVDSPALTAGYILYGLYGAFITGRECDEESLNSLILSALRTPRKPALPV